MFRSRIWVLCHCVILFVCAPSVMAVHTDNYSMKLHVSAARLNGEMKLDYINTSKSPISDIRLRLDMNIGDKSSITVKRVRDMEGHEIPWEYHAMTFGAWRSSKGQMVVHLSEPLLPGKRFILMLTFVMKSANAINPEMITLQDDPYLSLDAWYPKAMSPLEGGWSADDDRPSKYQVNITLPQSYALASTGITRSNTEQGQTQEIDLHAADVRGFSIYAVAGAKVYSQEKDGHAISVLLPVQYETWASSIHEAAFDVIKFYEQEYGAYPSKQLDIVCVGSMDGKAHGSAAACNVVVLWLSKQFESQYRTLIAHELAHQYVGSMVGICRNEIAWAPMGLGLMMERDYHHARKRDYSRMMKTLSWFYLEAERRGFDTRLSQSVELPLKSKPPWSFGWNMSLMHGKAMHVCLMLEDLLGNESFQAVARETIKRWQGRTLSNTDFIGLCKERAAQPLDWFFDDWFTGKATIDYGIVKVSRSEAGLDVYVKQESSAAYPVLVEAVYRSGEKLQLRADRKQHITICNLPERGEIVQVTIDPENIYPDIDKSNNTVKDFPEKPSMEN